MSQLSPEDVISEFEFFGLTLKEGSPLLEKLLDIGQLFQFDADALLNEWVAFSSKNNSCQLEPDSLDIWEGQLLTNRGKGGGEKKLEGSVRHTYSEKNLDELFPMSNGDDSEDNVMTGCGTPQQRNNHVGRKRPGVTTPTTPSQRVQTHRHTHSGTTTPRSSQLASTNGDSPYSSGRENSLIMGTPSVTYKQRKNASQVLCSLNQVHLPGKWAGLKAGLHVRHYSEATALKTPYQYMFQKVSEKALILLERIEKMGVAICDHNNLPSPLSVAQPSLEPAVFTGQIVCEGEGHLNARSCLLQGPSHSRWNKGACVRMEIPDNITCSLFPGQIVAVEGINNYNGMMVASRVFDEGVLPSAPSKMSAQIQGFTMLCAAGPFTTTDNLAYDPLQDLLAVVRGEKPDLLLLLGPFLEDTHPQVKSCDIPNDMTYEGFFRTNIMDPIVHTLKNTKTKLVLIPSQHDVHHPNMVYPQPPFQFQHGFLSDSCFPDPCTLDLNGLVVGVTSTDILFHLSARTMFKGAAGDRMARLTRHILQQQCYYPLLPAYQKEDSGVKIKPAQTPTDSTSSSLLWSSEDTAEVNLDLVHMFDHGYATMPTRPDVLLMSSSLKPFAKVVDGCICINPGRLTKKTSGGTFGKIMVKSNSEIGVEVVHI